MIRTGFGKLRKVIAINNPIFQELESFGQGKFFKMAMENFWTFVQENSKLCQNGYNVTSNTLSVVFVISLFIM